ncbi:TauD/TfdA family dioxygenase [Pseudomonas fluorescens]|nr:TauD/TfdA family dioxygenase [Pseudomonas fluorescens]
MKVIPYKNSSFGCEIIDLGSFENPTEEEKAIVREAFAKYGLVLIKGPIELQAQIELVSSIAPVGPEGDRDAIHSFVSTRPDEMVPGSGPLRFHRDYEWTDYGPALVLSLCALEMERPSPTTFADGVGAAQNLPAELRDRVRAMEVVLCAAFAEGSDGSYRQRLSHAPRYPKGTHFANAHPAIMRHPITGDEVLMVCEGTASHFVGMSEDESDPLFDEIDQYQYTDANLITHTWELGDLVIWDNFRLQHGRPAVPGGASRTLRRVVGNPVPPKEIVGVTVARFQT